MKRPPRYKVCFLPLLDDKDEHAYSHITGVQKFCQSKFDHLAEWCQRYNGPGLVAVDNARRQVAEAEGVFYMNPGLNEILVEELFDEHTDMKVRIRIRRLPK